MKLSIICPCYNEEATCRKVVEQLVEVPLGVEKEIIVVDDGSDDASYDMLKDIKGIRLIKHAKNQGKGAAFRTGVLVATGDYCVPFDLDTEYDPYDLLRCLEPIHNESATVVYGSRRLEKSNQQYSGFSFYLGGIGITMFTNLLYFSKLTDEPTCLKLVPTKLLREMKIIHNGFEWEPEITAKILKRGIKIYEVPIRYYPRTKKEGKKIKWKDGFQAIFTLIRYRLTN